MTSASRRNETSDIANTEAIGETVCGLVVAIGKVRYGLPRRCIGERAYNAGFASIPVVESQLTCF